MERAKWLGLALLLILAGCAPDIPPASCEPPDFDCYLNHVQQAVTVVRKDISFWSGVLLVLQILIVVLGISATILIALQDDKNHKRLRPMALVASACVTALGAAVVQLHIPENVDSLVDTIDRMVLVANDFDTKRHALVAGMTKAEVTKAYAASAAFRTKADALVAEFAGNYNVVKVEMLRRGGSAGRLNTLPAQKARSDKTAAAQ